MIKIVQEILKCRVWRWSLYALKLKNKPGDYACAVFDDFWKIAGTVIVCTDDKNILLIKTYRYAVDYLWYEFVRWALEEGFTSEENALKELQEETGINESPIIVKDLWEVFPDSGFIANSVKVVWIKFDNLEKFNIYWPRDWKYEQIYEVKLVNFDKFDKMIKENKIKDNFTLWAYMKFKVNL